MPYLRCCYLRRCCLLSALFLNACHWLAPYSAQGLDSGSADSARVDLAVDLTDLRQDAALADQRAALDAPLAKTLVCGSPEEVGSGGPDYLSEAALRTGGLELVAISSHNAYSTVRGSIDASFTQWEVQEQLFPGLAAEDPTFFATDAGERSIISFYSGAGVPRELQLCQVLAPSGCVPIAVFDSRGQIAADMDGPNVIRTGGGWLMAFNIQTDLDDPLTADIYLAKPRTPDLLAWQAWPAGVINREEHKEDDPALSPDGLTIVFEAMLDTGTTGLVAAFRSSLEDDFSPPQPVHMDWIPRNKPSQPLLADFDGRLELFFDDVGDSTRRAIFRTLCQGE